MLVESDTAGRELLKVSTRSNPNLVAGAIAGVIRHAGFVEIQVVGAGALNQAIKAVAIARGYLLEARVDLVCIPQFTTTTIDGEPRTAIHLSVEGRPLARAGPAPTEPLDAIDLRSPAPIGPA